MPKSINIHCESQLKEIRSQGLYRQQRTVETAQSALIRMDGSVVHNFSSNDYLGLANDPLMKDCLRKAVESYGVGSGASPLISGALQPLHDLQRDIAVLKGTESALVFSTGYATATGTLSALFGRNDILILDKLSHACLVDGAKMSQAKLRICRHNDVKDLEKLLQWASGEMSRRAENERGHICVVLESVYSMDGDLAPLEACVRLKEQYGAWLMVDEAHATGVLGQRGEGFVGSLGLSERVEIQMGTLGKALGCSGGFIAGSKPLIDLLINKARSLIFSTAPSPSILAPARNGMERGRSAEGETRRKCLFGLVDAFWDEVPPAWRDHIGQGSKPVTPIIPWHVGDAVLAVRLSDELKGEGYFVPAIRFPTVSRNSARLRITLTASHTVESVRHLARVVVKCHGRLKQ
jgi:8-amino-7-oxononanoate synthase